MELVAMVLASLVFSAGAGPNSSSDHARKNVLGAPLTICSQKPKTGYGRDGTCRAIADDEGTHTVCAVVTQAFLDFTRAHGNDLTTPRSDLSFPGLKPNDHWCLCALRWREALKAGVAPPVVLESTDVRTLEYVSLEALKKLEYRAPH